MLGFDIIQLTGRGSIGKKKKNGGGTIHGKV